MSVDQLRCYLHQRIVARYQVVIKFIQDEIRRDGQAVIDKNKLLELLEKEIN